MLSLPSGSALYRVFGPGLAVRGFYSGRERSLLGPGEFQLLQNMRCDEGLPRVRRGLSFLMNPPGFAVGPPLGATSCSLNGTRWVVAVWSDGTYGRVCVAPPSLDRWVEVSSTNAWTGEGGNNRLRNVSNPISFTVVKTPRYDGGPNSLFASRDVLLIQNGEDYPRMFDPDTENKALPLSIASATNATPIVVNTGSHNYSTGDHIYITGATGMPEMNGLWQITKTSPTTFSLNGSAGVFGHVYGGFGKAEDRIDLLVHKPVSVPSVIGYSYATFEAYFQVAGTSGKNYAGSGLNQSGRFELRQTNTSPYTSESTCVFWNIGTSAQDGDKAHIQFSTGISLGRQLVMLWEGLSISAMLSQVKIEVNPNNTTYNPSMTGWVTIYDPLGSTEQVKRNPVLIQESEANGRYWVIFDVGFVSQTLVFHIQLSRQGASPNSIQSSTLLFCGSGEGDINSDTTFGFTYEDRINRSESPLSVMTALSDSISLIGGPSKVKDGTSTISAPYIPLESNMLSAFRKTFINTDIGAAISGGLNGTPQIATTYIKRQGSVKHYFISSFSLFDYGYSGTTRSWLNSNYTSPMLSPAPISYSQTQINYNREAPSEFQQPIPIAATAAYANGRLFVGGVKDTDGQYGNGDVYFSWQRNPFRFQQIQEDDFRGGYLQVSGEKVQSFISGASSSLNAGKIYMLTDQSIYSLGDSGPLAGGSFAASDISRPVRMGPHGTISAKSVGQGYNSVFWVDQDSQLMRLANGEIVNIGKYQVHDKLETVPSNLTKNLAGFFRNDRYYLSLAKAGSSSNDTALIWNERMQGFESLDVPSKSLEQPFLHGTRIFFFHTDGKLYAYEENTVDDAGTPIVARFTTGSIVSSEWEGFFVNECQAMVTSSPGNSLNVNRVSRRWGATEPWTTTLSVDKSGAAVAIYRDSFAHTKVGANRGLETDWDWYLDVSGSLPPNSQFIRFECALQPTSVALGER